MSISESTTKKLSRSKATVLTAKLIAISSSSSFTIKLFISLKFVCGWRKTRVWIEYVDQIQAKTNMRVYVLCSLYDETLDHFFILSSDSLPYFSVK